MTTFNLKTGLDNISGGNGNDTFIATYNNGMTGTFAIGDALNGNMGIDTLDITPIGVAAIAPPDTLWNNISNIEKIVINPTFDGAQTITTGAAFQAAFAGAGINLKTTSGAGAITTDMSSFTGAIALTTTSDAGAQTLTMGSGLATVLATSTAGAQTISGANLASVKITSTGGGQTITSNGAASVTVQAISTAGVQTITTGAGADVISATTTAETNIIVSGAGNDTVTILTSATGNYTIHGNEGNDAIIGGTGNDTLYGDIGNDTLTGELGNDTLNGGLGSDRVVESGNVNFNLTNTSLTGLGNDTLINIESATLTGGIGNNTLNALSFTLGSVTLNGDAGNDLLIGGSQNDFLNGGDGNDTLAAKAGNDTVNGGNGIDIVTERADVNFTLTNTNLFGLGTDTLISIESSFLTGGVGNNSFNALAFTLGSVTQNGDAGNDVLRGGFGNDFLFGGDGNDGLRGAGNNNGVGSIDTLTGGAGNDTFYLSDSTTAFYNDGNNANAGLGDYALIKDFSSSLDKIQLEGAANLYVLGVSPIAGISGTAIYLDTNGNKAFNSTDELIAVVQGSGGLSLGSSYFTYV